MNPKLNITRDTNFKTRKDIQTRLNLAGTGFIDPPQDDLYDDIEKGRILYLGEISYLSGFNEILDMDEFIFLKYKIVLPPGYYLDYPQTGSEKDKNQSEYLRKNLEGITQYASAKWLNSKQQKKLVDSVALYFPIQLQLIYTFNETNKNDYPTLFYELFKVDPENKISNVGYGYQKIPVNVGYHRLCSDSFGNNQLSSLEREKQLFLGGTKRILNYDRLDDYESVNDVGEAKPRMLYGYQTLSGGKVHFDFNVIRQSLGKKEKFMDTLNFNMSQDFNRTNTNLMTLFDDK